jgi:ComF family protein
MINKFLSILFPEKCPVCNMLSDDHEIAPICSECWQDIHPFKGTRCQRCGRPLVSDISIECADCLREEPPFQKIKSYGIYDGTLRLALNLFKYYRIKRLAKPVSELLKKVDVPDTDMVIPVPLYKKRLRQREFNQSALIARYIARYTGAELSTGCLVKIRETAPQVGLNAQQRQKNVRNAFRVLDKHLIKGKSVLLIDDVFTTGATIRECSKMLVGAGAGDVFAITVAHGMID